MIVVINFDSECGSLSDDEKQGSYYNVYFLVCIHLQVKLIFCIVPFVI